MLHSFVDESKNPRFLLVAALVPAAHVSLVRQTINSFILPGQRRIHFHSERDSRKGQILTRIVELPISAVVYASPQHLHERASRDLCLSALVHSHLARQVRRLIIERDETNVDGDRRVIRTELLNSDAIDLVEYDHLRAYEESALAVPDALAWCWSRGGHWKAKIVNLVTETISVYKRETR